MRRGREVTAHGYDGSYIESHRHEAADSHQRINLYTDYVMLQSKGKSTTKIRTRSNAAKEIIRTKKQDPQICDIIREGS